MKLNGKTVVVTGAGGGVGRQLVLKLLEKGAEVAAVDINEAALNETVKASNDNSKLSIHVVNITDVKAVTELTDEVIKAHGNVDGLINNAGIIQRFIKINELTMEQINKVMNVNFYGTLNMVKAFLPLLLERPEAHITNISSMGGFLPVPGQVAYGASKAAVRLLTEGLYSELKGTNVGVSVILPGGISTDIAKNSGAADDRTPDAADSKLAAILLTPEKAADLIIKSMEKNKFRMFIGIDSNLLNVIYKFFSKAAINMINKALK